MPGAGIDALGIKAVTHHEFEHNAL